MSSNGRKQPTILNNNGRHTTCKLTNGQAWFVRATAGRIKVSELARYFRVTQPTIYDIRKGSTYQELLIKTADAAEIERLKRLFGIN